MKVPTLWVGIAVLLAGVDRAVGQTIWMTTPAPLCDAAAYDSHRDRLIGYNVNATWEFDGSSWQQVPSANMPPNAGWQFAFDERRGVTVAISDYYQSVWEWDGVNWTNAGAVPFFTWAVPPYVYPPYFGYHLTYHRGRKRVVVFVAGAGGAELHEWDGANWSPVSTTGGPPISPMVHRAYRYHAFGYDAAQKKLVLFGRTESSSSSGNIIAVEALTWDWNESDGWVEYPPSGPIGSPLGNTFMWFDAHRGKMIRYSEGLSPPSLRMREGAAWLPMNYVLNGLNPVVYAGCHDPVRNRFYSYQSATSSVAYLTDLYPAMYAPHGAGCTVANAPVLGLTESWTRAWLGGTLGVTVSLAPLSVAVLITGLSDQSFGATPLPLDLSMLGMPSCDLRVAPELLQLGVGTHTRVTFEQPIPADPAVVGTPFYQQALVLAPGANAAGILVSNSMRASIGWLR
ncbi:MAG TPA: hypothetical protein VFZ65_15685 [Planctomycetota bacterium]|nr:hypothetical protein [Planctomycetota bacterium]